MRDERQKIFCKILLLFLLQCADKGTLPGFCFLTTAAPAVYGLVNEWYDGDGFYVDLSWNRTIAQQQVSVKTIVCLCVVLCGGGRMLLFFIRLYA